MCVPRISFLIVPFVTLLHNSLPLVVISTGTQVQTLFGLGTNVVGWCVVGRVVWWNHWWFGVCLVQSICKKEKKEKEKRQKVNHED